MIKCEKCGKELKNRKAYAGHMWLAHLTRVGEKEKMRQRIRELEKEVRELKEKMKFEAGKCYICGKPFIWDLASEGQLKQVKQLVASATGDKWYHIECKKKFKGKD